MNTQRKLIAAMSLCASVAVPNIASAASISGQGTWESTLQGRDLDGDLSTIEAYYDTILDITWLSDTSYARTSGYDSDSFMDWSTADNWAKNILNPYGSGIMGWRLPRVSPIDGTTADDANISFIGTEDTGSNISAPGTLYAGSTASEMAHLFYNTLGNKSYCDPTTSTVSICVPQAGAGLTNRGPLNIVGGTNVNYWSATEYAPDTGLVWIFKMDNGYQDGSYKLTSRSIAWAVHDGDVGNVVPIPASMWLFGSGLLGLVGVARKNTV